MLRRATFAAFLTALLVVSPSFAQEPVQGAASDALQVGTRWHGVLTQRGYHPEIPDPPSEFDATLVVTKRDGNRFAGELRERAEGIAVVYRVVGEVGETSDDGTTPVTFENVGAKRSSGNFVSVTRTRFRAIIDGSSLRGSWKYPRNNAGITLQGTIELDAE